MTAPAAVPTSNRPRQIADLPSPRGVPLLGNLLQLSPARLHLILERWAEQLGTPYRFQVGAIPITVWTDPELIQSIMRERPHRYRRYQPIETVLEEIGCNGLFSAEGAAWEPQRRLVMQALSIPHVKAFYPTLADITERLRRRWLRAAERGDTVEMTDDLKRYTVDVTSALAFGEDPRTLEQEHGVIQEHLERILPAVMGRINALFPYWRYVKLPRDRQLDQSLVEIHRYVRAMMQRARDRMRDEPSDTPRNLLEAMLAQQQEPGSTITDDHISANVLTLLLAGEDTTADSIAWTLPYLAADAPLQQQLGDEARRVLGGAPVCPDYAALKDLDLFEAVCIEATRLRPVAAVHSFEPLEDVCVGGVALPKGTRMFFVARPAMLDPKHFADPQRYDPARWLHRHERDGSEAHDVRAYLQFGAGPRVCPGRHLATVEMRLVLSMLMNEFTIELATDVANIQEVSAFTMVPDTMPVKLKRRRG
ncbi:cytochrome P450 [Paraburkholderia caballeronis]|uniref:Cytochrome P450 n=1 Tax=Paraburkholderia caballeronis TaxID=416943 RepID=A0A1H7QPM9_9BURK|nr:cytochrome P450 [Paraburkholderia caballeronis]PXW22437.1 cytochrome P450 [Paraburkholderia caballeronis]PXW96308.1 cytochrome P450 [Paraburkholderia caballeronis]RAJ92719.1 cytochrome P450 [Paraburkholderia caballeronis]SEE01006.1 Cytochrome P450 [Paraburkholderia caballeronis]SEL49872.1 Cytochrome P450 [Paraburkholderia caballeronis]